MDRNNHGGHLNEDQILLSVVSESEIPEDVRSHMSACGLCCIEKEKIENDLDRLGRKASLFAPSSVKKARLASSIRHRQVKRAADRRLAFSLAAAVVLLAVLWSPVTHFYTQRNDVKPADQDEGGEDLLMAKIEYLSENALPDVYLDISADFYPVLDDEFIRSVVPSVMETDTSFSYHMNIKGVSQC